MAAVVGALSGETELDGLVEPVLAGLRTFLEPRGDRGDRINAFKKLSELLETYLKKILRLVNPSGYRSLSAREKKPALGALLLELGLATRQVLGAKSIDDLISSFPITN